MSQTNKLDMFKKISRELKLALGLVIDYSKGNYRNVKKFDILLIVAGFLYLLNPADIVPDFILFFGFVDDLSVLTYIVKKLDKELEKYDKWKNSRDWFFQERHSWSSKKFIRKENYQKIFLVIFSVQK